MSTLALAILARYFGVRDRAERAEESLIFLALSFFWQSRV
jgi:hypothetical protein